MSILVFLGLFLPVVISGLSLYFFKINNRILKLLIAFSGAFLLSLSFNEIIPAIYANNEVHEVHEACEHAHSHSGHATTIAIFVLIGFFIQLVLDYITKGVEHGHQHEHVNCNADHQHKTLSYIPILIGVCLHSFLEGMPLATNASSSEMQHHLLMGIAIHNIPISIVLMSLFIESNLKKSKVIILLMIFALSSPLGTLLSYLIGNNIFENLNQYFDAIMAIVVGIFLHISTTILFETDENHKFNLLKFATIIVGALVPFIHF